MFGNEHTCVLGGGALRKGVTTKDSCQVHLFWAYFQNKVVFGHSGPWITWGIGSIMVYRISSMFWRNKCVLYADLQAVHMPHHPKGVAYFGLIFLTGLLILVLFFQTMVALTWKKWQHYNCITSHTVAKSALWASFFVKLRGKIPGRGLQFFWGLFKKGGCLLGESDKQLCFFIYVHRILQCIDWHSVCWQSIDNQWNNKSTVA